MMWYPRNIFVMRNGRKQSIFLNMSFISQHAIESQITSLTIVFSTVYSDADQRKHQSSASLAFVRGIHRGPVNSLHKWPVTRKMFLCDDVVMYKSVTGSSLPCSDFATILNLMLRVLTGAYLGHGEKTNYSANPPGRNTNPPGRNSQSARAE